MNSIMIYKTMTVFQLNTNLGYQTLRGGRSEERREFLLTKRSSGVIIFNGQNQDTQGLRDVCNY